MGMGLSFVARLRLLGTGFFRDDDGSATIWSLTWLLLFAGMAGLAIDSTNAWRVKTMLASTADASSLAGAWDLPQDYLDLDYAQVNQEKVKDSAELFATRNMSTAVHGNYIDRDEDIFIGHWNSANRTFIYGSDLPAMGESAPAVNAVRVFLGQNDDRGNSLPTILLRITGFTGWDINVVATAMLGVIDCQKNYGVIARNELKLSSQYTLATTSCLHGQKSVDLGPHGEWADPNAITTGEDPPGDWKVSNTDQTIIGTGEPITFPPDGEGHRDDLYPPMVDYIPTIGAGMLSGYLHFRHFAYPVPAADQIPPAVVTMPRGFNRVNGTVPPETGSTGWWNDGTIRLASVDGFASIAGLLSLAEPPPADEPYPLPVDENGDVMGIPTQQYEDDWHNKNVYNWDLDPTQIPEDLDATNFTAYSPSTATQATLEEEKIYFVDQCSQGGTGTLLLTGTIRNVTIVTNCKIDIAGSARIENAVLLTTAGNVKNGETSGITISNGAKIGAPTQCENWGGVRMYSAGDIYANGTGSNPDSADQSQFWGAQLVARNRIHFAAKSDSEKGISLLAGGDIDIAAQAEIGALTVTTPYPVAGCPEYGVKPEVDSSVYQPALVQ